MRAFNTGLLAIILLVALVGCEKSEKFIMLENTVHQMRIEEAVVIDRDQLETYYGEIAEGLYPLVIFQSGDTLPSQADDLNGDGQWDELVFLATLPPHRKHGVRVEFVPENQIPDFDKRTNVRMARIEGDNYIEVSELKRLTAEEGLAGGVFQMEGPGWENDKVGFRNYFDIRNGMDIFGKTTSEMAMERVGINQDYHYKQDWGQDILRVGASLGAGSIALEIDGELYRIAPDSDASLEVIADGPVRSVIRFFFNGWSVEGNTYDVVHEVAIYPGTWYYESKVYLPGHTGESTLVAGITTMDLGEKDAVMKDFEGKVTTVATHGPQAYDYESLGMAILVQNDYFSGIGRVGPDAEDINNSVLVKMSVQDSNPVQFRFYACWEMSDELFSEEQQFIEFLDKEASKMASPILITFQ
jgi:hypothetical protein